jgi:polyphosphate glucokinase
MTRIALGVDIGGSGIKGAPVDLTTGHLTEERYRIPTPQPATPSAVGRVVADVIRHFKLDPGVPVGVTFPGVVQQGVVRTAANLDKSWVGVNLRGTIRTRARRDVRVMNDADAAGFAEYQYGAAEGRDGVVLMVTLGTGIGTALIADGRLVPNIEMGHLVIDGKDAEDLAAESARERHGLDWAEWATHVNRYLQEMERLLWPDLIVIGGGVSKDYEEFVPLLTLRAPVVPAELRNEAGIVGAAAQAAEAARISAQHSARRRESIN